MMNKNALAVGIDIGGTNTVFVSRSYCNCVSHDSIKTSHFQLVEDFVDAVCLKLNKLIADHTGVEIIGVGIGAQMVIIFQVILSLLQI